MSDDREFTWMMFASFILMIDGIFKFIWGITALVKEEYFYDQWLFGNMTLWGVIWIIIGVITFIAAFAILGKAQWARWFGIVMAGLGVVGMFTVIWAYPIWALVIIALDVLVIYALARYGGRESHVET